MATKSDSSFLTDKSRPATHNYLATNYFTLTISRAPTVSYFAQEVSLPAINLPEAIQPTIYSTNIPIPGNAYTFMPLNVKFILDENLRGWQEIYNWVKSIGNYKSTKDTVAYKDKFSDITLHITNSAYKHKFEVIFRNAFPISLSEIALSVQGTDNNPVSASASFKYAYYDFNVLTSS